MRLSESQEQFYQSLPPALAARLYKLENRIDQAEKVNAAISIDNQVLGQEIEDLTDMVKIARAANDQMFQVVAECLDD